jgi:hypothetical protein
MPLCAEVRDLKESARNHLEFTAAGMIERVDAREPTRESRSSRRERRAMKTAG